MDTANEKPGFISIEKALKLIKSDTKENPVVDMDYMIARLKWIEVGGNFRIPKLRKLTTEEQTTDRFGRTKVLENTGEVYVEIKDNLVKELLKKALNDKYYELTHKEYAELKTRGVSTVADDAQGEAAVRPRARKETMAKPGESLGGGVVTTNGEGLQV